MVCNLIAVLAAIGMLNSPHANAIGIAQFDDRKPPFALTQSSNVDVQPKEDIPVAHILIPSALESPHIALINHEGSLYALANPEQLLPIPVLSGLEYAQFELGVRLPKQVAIMIAYVAEIAQKTPDLHQQISEIVIGQSSDGYIEYQIYLHAFSRPIYIDQRLLIDDLEKLLVLVSTIDLHPEQIQAIDIRGEETIVIYE